MGDPGPGSRLGDGGGAFDPRRTAQDRRASVLTWSPLLAKYLPIPETDHLDLGERMPSCAASRTTEVKPDRRRADVVVRRLLQIPDSCPVESRPDVRQAFTKSVFLSAARCLLTYVFVPFLAPLIGLAAGVGPWLGIPLSGVAVGANILSIRRFWLADHRHRWAYSAICVGVMTLLVVLVLRDVTELAG